jgi:hypothetical protein
VSLNIRATPPTIPHVRLPQDHTAGGPPENEEDLTPSQLTFEETNSHVGDAASTQAGDPDAALTQDSTVAEVGDDLGTSSQQSTIDESEEGTTVDIAAPDERTEVEDAVQPNTTDTAVVIAGEEVVGEVHVAAPNGEIAEAEAAAVINGDINQPVQNIAAAEVVTEVGAIGDTQGDNVMQNAVVATAEVVAPPAQQPVNANAESYTPQRWTAEELQRDDPMMQDTTPADQTLISSYGDTIHQNDGRHLDGGIGVAKDRKWQ